MGFIYTLAHYQNDSLIEFHIAGLLYLSTYEVDFTGGRLRFLEDEFSDNVTEEVEPKTGRVVLFTSGKENFHYVERVTSGERFVLAFWFTCDPSRQFEIFLDGKKHQEFSHKVRDALRVRKISRNQEL